MKILIKENDRLKSTIHKGRMVSEYLIYLMNGEIPVKCFNEVGDIAKQDRVNEILLTDFEINDWKNNNLSEIITEVSYENLKHTI